MCLYFSYTEFKELVLSKDEGLHYTTLDEYRLLYSYLDF